MHAFAWLLNDLFFEDRVWVGFVIEAALFFVVAAIAGLIAYRALQAGSPPTPELAIEEGKRIRQTLEAGTTPAAKEPVPPPAQEPREAVSSEPEVYAAAPASPSPAAPPRPRAAARPRSAPTSSASARSSRSRSRRFAAGSPSSPTGAARCASTAAS